VNDPTVFSDRYERELCHTDFFCLIAGIDVDPEGNEPAAIVQWAVTEHRELDPDLDRLCRSTDVYHATMTCRMSGAVADFDPTDSFRNTVTKLFPGARIVTCLAQNVTRGRVFLCALVFPKSRQEPRYRRLDHEMPGLGIDPGSCGHDLKHEISRSVDLRRLLACRGFHRRLTVCAGSPGHHQGGLNAIWNDYNALFGLLCRFAHQRRLPGLTAIGLVRAAAVFREFLNELRKSEMSVSDLHARAVGAGFIGNVIKDTAFNYDGDWGCIVHNCVYDGSTLGGTGTREADLVGSEYTSHEKEDSLPYALISYSGHGNATGSLDLDEGKILRARDVFELSYESQTPFVLILDMCHAHEFGAEYASYLRAKTFPGLVLCATSEKGSCEAYESETMGRIRRPGYPFAAEGNRSKVNRGVFSTALCLGLMIVRDTELATGREIRISVKKFTDDVLRPLCDRLAPVIRGERKVQVPTVFSG